MTSQRKNPKDLVKSHIKSIFNYEFSDEQLAIESATHRSSGKRNYERFELLGDSIIQLVITEILLSKFKKSNEGDLSRMRQFLVNKTTLSKIALEFELDKILISRNLNFKENVALKKSINADLFESIIGAIYLDSGFQKCKSILSKIFSKLINSENSLISKDPKTQLQEYLQSKNLGLPVYKKIKVKSPDHQPKFKISCKVSLLNNPLTTVSRTVKEGEQIVAKKTLDKIIHGK